MKKIATSALLVLLCITFVMGVYCYGTEHRYSLWGHFKRIVAGFESFPSMMVLGDIWTKDELNGHLFTIDEVDDMVSKGEISEELADHYKYEHTMLGIAAGTEEYCNDPNCYFALPDNYVRLEPHPSDNDIINALNSVIGFFNRIRETIKWLGGFLLSFLGVIYSLFPWNGLVDADTPLFGDLDDLEFITSEEEATTDYNWPDETDMTDSGWGDIGEDTGPVIIL